MISETSKVFIFEEEKWRRFCLSDLKNIKLGDLMDGTIRLIANVEYKKIRIYFCMDDKDYTSLKNKYPRDRVIHIGQIMHFFNGHLGEERIATAFNNLIILMRYFPEAKVLDVK